MTTQVIFKVDKKIKDLAMKRAQDEGVPFSSVLKFATKAFAEGYFNVGLIVGENFNSNALQEINRVYDDIKKGKNLSPRFISSQKAIDYLKK